MRIKAGPLTFKSPFLLAPVAGFTDSIYRRIASSFGAGLTVTELASADGIVRGSDKSLELMRFTEEERPLAIQLFGSSPGVMAEAARAAEKLNPDAIDINMGCPSSRICRDGNGGGAALLTDPGLAAEIAGAVAEAVSVPVTAKIRIGWDQQRRNYLEIAERLEGTGIAALFVHGRTRSQKYSGSADWDAIAEIVRNCSIPVIGNGDIKTAEEARERLRSSGCPAVMIGRGALGNPWIFSGSDPDSNERKDIMIRHLDMMTAGYGDRGIILMRKHIACYIRGFRNASGLRKQLFKALSRDEIIEILTDLH